MSAGEIVKQALDGSSLKYVESDGNFGLSFKGENRTGIIVIARPQPKYVSVFAQVPDFPQRDEETVLHNYLRLSFEADLCKLTRDRDGSYFVVAEVPSSLITASTIELAIRWVVQLVDFTPAQLLSLEQMRNALLFMQLHQFLSGPSAEQLDGAVPDLLRQAGMTPERVAERKHRFVVANIGDVSLKMLALCRPGVLTLAGGTDIKATADRLAFYRRMAEANQVMDVGKVALDNDDEVSFLYELPGADAPSVREAVERMHVYMPIYVLTLITGQDPATLAAGIAAGGSAAPRSGSRSGGAAASSGGCTIPVMVILTAAGLIVGLWS